MLLFARSQGHARCRAQSIIGVSPVSRFAAKMVEARTKIQPRAKHCPRRPRKYGGEWLIETDMLLVWNLRSYRQGPVGS
jgi:hypothetical protein